ncbi:hypothetical protein [Nannocystis pusilla]|uniref:hypothetical protein n=1 Tax=Nannocystis pusilla TaxID=889268 RepID=UPI003B7FD76B
MNGPSTRSARVAAVLGDPLAGPLARDGVGDGAVREDSLDLRQGLATDHRQLPALEAEADLAAEDRATLVVLGEAEAVDAGGQVVADEHEVGGLAAGREQVEVAREQVVSAAQLEVATGHGPRDSCALQPPQAQRHAGGAVPQDVAGVEGGGEAAIRGLSRGRGSVEDRPRRPHALAGAGGELDARAPACLRDERFGSLRSEPAERCHDRRRNTTRSNIL